MSHGPSLMALVNVFLTQRPRPPGEEALYKYPTRPSELPPCYVRQWWCGNTHSGEVPLHQPLYSRANHIIPPSSPGGQLTGAKTAGPPKPGWAAHGELDKPHLKKPPTQIMKVVSVR
jgi:hypothetical protein